MGGIYHPITPPREASREAYTTVIPLREASREAYTCIYTSGRLAGRHVPLIHRPGLLRDSPSTRFTVGQRWPSHGP